VVQKHEESKTTFDFPPTICLTWQLRAEWAVLWPIAGCIEYYEGLVPECCSGGEDMPARLM